MAPVASSTDTVHMLKRSLLEEMSKQDCYESTETFQMLLFFEGRPLVNKDVLSAVGVLRDSELLLFVDHTLTEQPIGTTIEVRLRRDQHAPVGWHPPLGGVPTHDAVCLTYVAMY